MKKFAFQFIALIIVILGAIYLISSGSNMPFLTRSQPSTQKSVQINDAKIKVEIADTQAKRTKGLGGKDSLAQDEGMFFVFQKQDRYSFWMKGLKFPLDIIWINGDRVVDILTNVPAPQKDQKDETLRVYQPVTFVDKVLEVNAGVANKLQIKIGDTVLLLNQ